jgi:poly(3-hydroxybutyrate) depolymerase
MSKNYLLIIMLFSLTCCRKDDTTPIQNFDVFVQQGLNNATVFWNPIKGYSDSVVEFTVYISDSVVASHLKTRSYKISHLTENTKYTGKIEGWSESRKIAEQLFEFTTLKNQPPLEFSISEINIGKNSVVLQWNRATDPENSPVVYDIYLDSKLVINSTNQLSCTIPGLNSNTTYAGEIAARDTAGNTTKTTFSFKTINTSSILVHRFFKYQGYQREFAFYVPLRSDVIKNMPLIINLHGANGNAWNEIRQTPFKTIADRENFILLMPQALLGTFLGQTYYQWNAHYIFPWDDVSLLNYLIDYLYTRYDVDLSKIYLTGMSNGGYMTFFTIRELQDRIAAIAPISGLMSANVYNGYTLKRRVPLCYMHGTSDNIVKIDGYPSAEMILNLWIANNKCATIPEVTELPDIAGNDNSTVTLYEYSGDSPDSEIQYYKIVGGGHSIPGVEPGANQDINAYEVIWSFFKQHTYPAHTEGKIVDIN